MFLEISKRIDIPPAWRPFLSGRYTKENECFKILSICSTLAWTIVFPLDVMKSQVQGSSVNDPFLTRVKNHYNRFGFRGFFRGYGPACTRSIIANGLSMVMVILISIGFTFLVSENKSFSRNSF